MRRRHYLALVTGAGPFGLRVFAGLPGTGPAGTASWMVDSGSGRHEGEPTVTGSSGDKLEPLYLRHGPAALRLAPIKVGKFPVAIAITR
jgi:hypothetical protein